MESRKSKKMAESFKNLKVWNNSVALATIIYKLTKKYPKDEVFGIISQLRRAVVSISSNIAEGSSRKSGKDYCRFIDISIGSLNEVESLIQISLNLGYISENDFSTIQTEVNKLGLLLGGFRKYLIK